MAEERLNNLEEKLKHLLTDLEGDTSADDWGALSEKLDKQDAKGGFADFGALLSTVSGEADANDWSKIVNRLDKLDAKAARRKRAVYVSFTAAIIAGLIALFTVNPFNAETNRVADTATNNSIEESHSSEGTMPNMLEDDLSVKNQNSPTANSNTVLDAIDDVINTGTNPAGSNMSNSGNAIGDNNVADNTEHNNRIGNNGGVTTPDSENNNQGEDNQNNTPVTTDENLADNTAEQKQPEKADEAVIAKQDEDKVIAKQDEEEDIPANEDAQPTLDLTATTANKNKKQKQDLAYNPLRNRISLGFFISPEYVISNLEAQPNSSEAWKVNKRYEDINNNQRSNGLGFTTGFSFNYNPFKNINLSIKTGVRYTENTENVNFDYEINEVVVDDDITKTLYYIPLPSSQRYQIKRATTNKISYIEVPFSFGYNFNIGEKGKARWSVAPIIGGSFTKMLNASGVKLNETTLQLEDVNYNDLNKTNWTINASVGVYYQLNNKFSIGVIPTYRTYLQTIESGNNYLKNRPYTIGINTGIRYSLF